MAGGRCAENAVLAQHDFLHAICCADLGNQLDRLWVVETSISTNDKEGTVCTLGD